MVVSFFAFAAYLVYQHTQVTFSLWMIPVTIVALVAGAFASDLISGLVHWACDTWGSIHTPIMGRLFIRQFREHHSDSEEITRHDFVETNGTNAGLALIPLAGAWAMSLDPDAPDLTFWAARIVLISLAVFTTLTSQAHKWAHLKVRPGWVTVLQRARLILSPEHHAVHHIAPHRHHYSITGGWVDGVLEKTRFFRHSEDLIMRVTGAKMAVDDDPVALPDQNM